MRTLAIVMLVLFIAAACQSATQEPTPTVPAPGQEPSYEAVPTTQDDTRNAAQAQPNAKIDPEVAKLFQNSANIKSYSFDIVYLPEKSARFTYSIKGNKARIDLTTDLLFDGGTADVIFVDYDARTARAYCMKRNICDRSKSYAVDYDKYAIVRPIDWVPKFKQGTKIRTLTFDNAPVTLVRYDAALEADKKHYEAYVHNYWGVPVRVAIANDAAMADIVAGYEYRAMAFNTVTDGNVTPPK